MSALEKLKQAVLDWVEIGELTSPPCTVKMLEDADEALYTACREYAKEVTLENVGDSLWWKDRYSIRFDGEGNYTLSEKDLLDLERKYAQLLKNINV